MVREVMQPKRNENFFHSHCSFSQALMCYWGKEKTNKQKQRNCHATCPCMYETTLFLCFLFAISCRKEREANVRLGRPRSSKLLASTENANNNEDDEDHESQFQSHSTELSHPVRELCKTVNAFIYVVDSSADSDRGTIIICFSFIFSCKKGFKLLLD